MSIGDELFSIEDRDTMGKIADELAGLVAKFYDIDPSKVTEEDLGMLMVSRYYLKMYQALFT